MTDTEKILVTGAGGQIGSALVYKLRARYGNLQVIATDIKEPPERLQGSGVFELLNVLDKKKLKEAIEKHQPTQIYHLAAMLSATAEKNPRQAWQLNMDGLLNVLDLGVEYRVGKIFWPSSIAVFGPGSPKDPAPQQGIMDPSTIYGISKLAGEHLCAYYHRQHGLDVRSLRYPGLIGWEGAPGGGTTDYAVDIFHEALKTGRYHCFLAPGTRLPMMNMQEAIRAALELMDAPSRKISIRTSYNIAGMSFTPAEIAREIQKHLPDFKITYRKNDPRQLIADTWPARMNDTPARQDWGWKSSCDLEQLVREMLEHLQPSGLPDTARNW